MQWTATYIWVAPITMNLVLLEEIIRQGCWCCLAAQAFPSVQCWVSKASDLLSFSLGQPSTPALFWNPLICPPLKLGRW